MFENHRNVVDGPLAVRSFPEGEEVFVVLIGELDRSNVNSAATVIEEVLAVGATPVVVDLQELEFLDSSGVALLAELDRAKSSRGRLRVVPSRSLGVSRILASTGLDGMLTMVRGAGDQQRLSA
jgi:anti-sigma B factor antagonist